MWITNAYAQAAGATADPTGGLMQLLPLILMFVARVAGVEGRDG